MIALFDAADRWHKPFWSWQREVPGVRRPTTWPFHTEAYALPATRRHGDASLGALRWVELEALDVDRPEHPTPDVLSVSERFAEHGPSGERFVNGFDAGGKPWR